MPEGCVCFWQSFCFIGIPGEIKRYLYRQHTNEYKNDSEEALKCM
ncbi:hypothetical protein ANACAC_03417 [Anaerostipes caccae L1-92]|uniref:Uncharacterized protein n=1 Tax=Anaerostipes caccae (strain DSM 14662 / CCUG 47493 / JCM 13470 / NCIMB 13811 / L1-92) TaxID=411490 RepID=B0MIG2_ANACD|nr:hypothetical protein ANACAC_03417 [Anaerostipes caccae L1-92]